MRVSNIVLVLITLTMAATTSTFSRLNALACGPSSTCCANHGNHGGGGGTPKAGQAITYTCPMHPEVTADKPGKCPKCKMFLEAKAADKTVFTCPMHPEVKADKAGKCPKCGMNLEKKTEKVVYEYYCSMCPGVVSDKPGTCPKCGMFMEARPKASAAPSADPHAGHAH